LNEFRSCQPGGVAEKLIRVQDRIPQVVRDVACPSGDSQFSRAITMHDVETLPQLERYPITLALFQPGVQVAGGNVVNSRLNGARGGSNVTTVDGIDATDPWGPALLWSVFSTTDSTQEFRMIRHGAKAQYGRNAGAQIEMVTRSGTNRREFRYSWLVR
jgi:hypothetical protein